MGGYDRELAGDTKQCHCSPHHWRNFGKLVLAVHRRSVFLPQNCPTLLQAMLPSHPSHKHLACDPPASATTAASYSVLSNAEGRLGGHRCDRIVVQKSRLPALCAELERKAWYVEPCAKFSDEGRGSVTACASVTTESRTASMRI